MRRKEFGHVIISRAWCGRDWTTLPSMKRTLNGPKISQRAFRHSLVSSQSMVLTLDSDIGYRRTGPQFDFGLENLQNRTVLASADKKP
jgi:hypothetical protein